MQVSHRGQSPNSRRGLVPQGVLQLSNAGAWHSYWRDPYHLLLKIPWSGFFLLMVLGYGLLNALFALAYLVGVMALPVATCRHPVTVASSILDHPPVEALWIFSPTPWPCLACSLR